jgi:hypothetical protein
LFPREACVLYEDCQLIFFTFEILEPLNLSDIITDEVKIPIYLFIHFDSIIVLLVLLFFLSLIEAAEIKLLRPLAGYTLRDHKYDDIRSEL